MDHRHTPSGICLIVGCGYVGTRLALRLRETVPVLAWVRRTTSVDHLTAVGLPARAVDFDQVVTEALALPSDLAAVVYLAPPSGVGREDQRLARCLQALGATRPGVFLYMSTTGVYGDTGGASVDEDSPLAPREDRSHQRMDAERRVAAWCIEHGARAVCLRVPAIYGPHRLPLERLQRGEPVLRDEDSGPGNRIQVDDLVDACLTALARPVSGAFNLTDGAPESMAAFTTRVAAEAGLPVPRRITWAEAQTELSPGLLSFLRESRRVTTRRGAELGWTPRYADPAEGIRASLREMDSG